MTSKKSSLWKSSWNRGRGTPLPDILGKMGFFQNFAANPNIAEYRTAINSSLGLALPYWFASVGINPGLPLVSSPALQISPSSDTGLVTVITGADGAANTVTLAVTGDAYVSAALVVVTAVPAPGLFSVRTYLENQVAESVLGGAPYTPGAGLLTFNAASLPTGLHGFAGGPGVPTLTQIQDWFLALKANLAIQAIPGMTTHLYSAASVIGVPATLPNGGSAGAAQNMTLVVVGGVPAPQHNALDVRFAY